MSKCLTIVDVLEMLSDDGYEPDLLPQDNALKLIVKTENGKITANRFIPNGAGPRELALIFWDISSSLKRLERKFNLI